MQIGCIFATVFWDCTTRCSGGINRQLEEHGVLVKKGAIVGARITGTPRRLRGQKEYEVVEDRAEEEKPDIANARLVEKPQEGVDMEARWIKKAGKTHFGYKRHTVTNQDGLVMAEETTPANESDMKLLITPIDKADLPQGTPVTIGKADNRQGGRKQSCPVLSCKKQKEMFAENHFVRNFTPRIISFIIHCQSFQRFGGHFSH